MVTKYLNMAIASISRDLRIWILLLVAFALRLSALDVLSFSNDELSALYRTELDGFALLIKEGVIPDFHPAGVQIFLYYWVKLVGLQEFWVRLPFAALGALSVLLLFLIGKRWYNETTGLIAASFLAVLEFPVLYSVIARPYASGLFFILLVAWFWTRFVLDMHKMGRKRRWIYSVGFGLSLFACMMDHYFCFLTAAIIGMSGLWMVKREVLWYYIGAACLAVILFLPHIPISLAHFSIGGLSTWLGQPDIYWPLQHWSYIFNGSIWWAALACLLLLLGLLKHKPEAISPFFLLFWWLIPLVIGWTYSMWVNPVLQHSILLFGFPFLLLFLASGLSCAKSQFVRWIAPSILALGLMHIVFFAKFYQRQHFADFRDSGNFVQQLVQELGVNALTWAININNPWYINHYLDTEARSIAYVSTDIKTMDDLKGFLAKLDSMKTSELVYISLKPEPKELSYAIHDRFPGLKIFRNHDGCSWYAWLDNDPQKKSRLMLPKEERVFGAVGSDSMMVSCGDTLFWADVQGKPMAMRDSLEYGPQLRIHYEEMPEAAWVHLQVGGCLLHEDGDPQLVLSIEDEKGKVHMWRSSSFKVFMPIKHWGRVHLFYDLDKVWKKGRFMSIYVWNHGQKEVVIDEVSAEIGY